MGVGQVEHVDVVADAGAVRGGVVVAEDARGRVLRQLLEDHRDQVEDAGVREVRGRRARHVEVAQGGRGQARRPACRADQPLAGQLRLAVGRHGHARRLLRDQLHVRHAVDRRRGREHEGGHPGRTGRTGRSRRPGPGHLLQQDPQTLDVLPVVVQRQIDRLAHLLLRRQMHDPGDGVVREGARHALRVQGGTHDQRHPVRDALGDSRGQVVVHHRALARLGHRPYDVRSDVAGAAGDQPGHVRPSPRQMERDVRVVRGRTPASVNQAPEHTADNRDNSP